MKQSSILDVVITLIIFFLFGLSFAMIKHLALFVSPEFLIGSRMFVVGFFSLIFFRGFNVLLSLDTKIFLKIICCGTFGHFASNFCEMIAIKNLSLGMGGMIYGLTPIVTAVLSSFITKDKLINKQIVFVLTATLGIMIVGYKEIVVVSNFQDNIVMIAAMITGSYIWVQTREIESTKQKNLSFVNVNAASMFVAGIIGVVSSLFSETFYDGITFFRINGNFWYFVSLIISSNILAVFLYGYLLSRASATYVSMAGTVSIPMNILIGVLIFGESINIYTFSGGLLTILSVIAFIRSEEYRT